MKTRELTTLHEVLANCEIYPCEWEIYIANESWTLKTVCAVIDPSWQDFEKLLPAIAVRNKLLYAIGIDTVQDIRSNALAQKPSLTPEELLQAFLYYYDYDAFMEFK